MLPSVSTESGTKLAKRLLAKVTHDGSGCWVWKANRHYLGYGRIQVEGSSRYAHRVSYELFVGPIPEGLTIDHLCRNRSCVNPKHLEPVTHAEDMARSAPATKTHCKNGHPLSGPNLYVNATSGRRQCRACMVVARARYEEKRRPRTVPPYSDPFTDRGSYDTDEMDAIAASVKP